MFYVWNKIVCACQIFLVPLCTVSSSSLASCATFPPAIMQPHVAGHLNKNCVMSTGRGLTPYHSRYMYMYMCGWMVLGLWTRGDTIVDRLRSHWSDPGPPRWQFSTLSFTFPSELARLICVNHVSYASTIMKTLLTCISLLFFFFGCVLCVSCRSWQAFTFTEGEHPRTLPPYRLGFWPIL